MNLCPKGWKFSTSTLKDGTIEKYWLSPTGKKFTTFKQVTSFIKQQQQEPPSPSETMEKSTKKRQTRNSLKVEQQEKPKDEEVPEKVLKSRTKNGGGKTEYFIKWIGLPHSQNSWVPERDVPGDLIKDFKAKQKEAEKEWEVEEIISKKKYKGTWYYEVKWKGYESDQNTWETESNLKKCEDLMEKFKEKYQKEEEEKAKKKVPKDGEESDEPGSWKNFKVLTDEEEMRELIKPNFLPTEVDTSLLIEGIPFNVNETKMSSDIIKHVKKHYDIVPKKVSQCVKVSGYWKMVLESIHDVDKLADKDIELNELTLSFTRLPSEAKGYIEEGEEHTTRSGRVVKPKKEISVATAQPKKRRRQSSENSPNKKRKIDKEKEQENEKDVEDEPDEDKTKKKKKSKKEKKKEDPTTQSSA